MTELQRYMAEEVAEDHADGIITRREAMRRLGLLGLTTGAATAMLTGFAAPAIAGDTADEDYGGDFTEEWAPVATEAVTFAGPRGPLMGAWAPAEHARGGVLVIHENRGLTPHIALVAGRLAANGYASLAVDLVSEEGGTAAIGDEARVAAILGGATPERLVGDLRAGVGELRRRLPRTRIATIGFCFGGGLVWMLLAAGEPRLSAAVPFYGPFPVGGDLSGSRAAVLAVYGGRDARVLATRPAAHAALEAAGLRHEILTFTDADHAFFNETGARYDAPAAGEAYRRTLDWFERHVAKRRRGGHRPGGHGR